MKTIVPLTSRRFGLATAAAFALGALAKPGEALAQQQPMKKKGCCGGGPPDGSIGPGPECRVIGMDLGTVTYDFKNAKQDQPPYAWWIFAVGANAPSVLDYFNFNTSEPAEIVVYDTPTPEGPGKAYVLDWGFVLRLTWPSGNLPIFYPRPLVGNELP